jgi:hypothetical protein
MKLLTKEEFSTKMVSDLTETEAPTSQIYINGNAINAFVTGEALRACIRYHTFYLVFMTDYGFEDWLDIFFLDEKFNSLDYAALGSIYSTGIFQLLTIKEPDTVVFDFFGDTSWKITLSTKKHFVLPFSSEPFFAGYRWIHRKFAFSRYFKLSRNKD